jgi:uncharacterized membrane protein YdbT with pleckstrin-like domain
MYKRTHPFMIVSNLRRFLFLIIIPVLRGLFSALQLDLLAWLRGAWIDVLIFLVMLTAAVLRWSVTAYTYDENALRVRSGLFLRRETVIFWDRVTAMSLIKSFYLRPFRAAYLRADTMGGSFKSADLALYLHRDKARELMDFRGWGEDPAAVKRQYVPGARSILSMSVLTSNSFAGIVFIATFFSQSGKLLGNEFADMLLSTFEDIARTLAFGIPPAAAAIAYVLLGGWLIGFLLTFIRYHDFVIVRSNSTLRIHSGAATQRQYTIRQDRVNFIDIRQNVAAKLLKVTSLYISAVGYGKVKDDISCIIPNETAANFERNRQMLFPDFCPATPTIRSPRRGIFRFIGQPLIPCLTIPLAMILLSRFFPSWVSFIVFVGSMSLIPPILFLIVRMLAFRIGGAARNGSYYTICYSSGFNIHTVVIPQSKIVSVRIRQSLFQARGKSRTCDVTIHTVAEGRKRHVIRNLPRTDAEKLFEKNLFR